MILHEAHVSADDQIRVAILWIGFPSFVGGDDNSDLPPGLMPAKVRHVVARAITSGFLVPCDPRGEHVGMRRQSQITEVECVVAYLEILVHQVDFRDHATVDGVGHDGDFQLGAVECE